MRFPRMTTRRLMGLVLWSAVAFAAFFQGMPALAPLVFAAVAILVVPRPPGRRTSAALALVLVSGIVLIPLLIAGLTSKAMWGYYFVRPGLDRRIANARRVDSVTLIETKFDPDGRPLFVPLSSSFTLAQLIDSGRKDPYYSWTSAF